MDQHVLREVTDLIIKTLDWQGAYVCQKLIPPNKDISYGKTGFTSPLKMDALPFDSVYGYEDVDVSNPLYVKEDCFNAWTTLFTKGSITIKWCTSRTMPKPQQIHWFDVINATLQQTYGDRLIINTASTPVDSHWTWSLESKRNSQFSLRTTRHLDPFTLASVMLKSPVYTPWLSNIQECLLKASYRLFSVETIAASEAIPYAMYLADRFKIPASLFGGLVSARSLNPFEWEYSESMSHITNIPGLDTKTFLYFACLHFFEEHPAKKIEMAFEVRNFKSKIDHINILQEFVKSVITKIRWHYKTTIQNPSDLNKIISDRIMIKSSQALRALINHVAVEIHTNENPIYLSLFVDKTVASKVQIEAIRAYRYAITNNKVLTTWDRALFSKNSLKLMTIGLDIVVPHVDLISSDYSDMLNKNLVALTFKDRNVSPSAASMTVGITVGGRNPVGPTLDYLLHEINYHEMYCQGLPINAHIVAETVARWMSCSYNASFYFEKVYQATGHSASANKAELTHQLGTYLKQVLTLARARHNLT